MQRTWFLAFIGGLYTKAIKRGDTGTADQASEGAEGEEDDELSGTDSASAPGSGTSTPKGKGVRTAATLAGGRRRKAVRKR